MKIIGITGGVGSGKTLLLEYIKENYNCRIMLADNVANDLKKPGQTCYEQIVELLGTGILDEKGVIQNDKMAALIFADKSLLESVNQIVHPAVKAFITEEIQKEKEKEEVDFFFLEAALLIEGGYETVVDEMWYIFVEEDIRRMRLKKGRNYPDEKIDRIMRSQLSQEQFRKHCKIVIDNSKEPAYAFAQIDKIMGEYPWKKQKNIPGN